MKTIILSILFAALAHFADAQISFRTGDPDLDRELNTLNKEAKSDIERFKENVSLIYGIKKDRVVELLSKKFEPAEIEFACRISRVAKKDFESVIRLREADRSKGWGELAKELGIKPGSAEFHALKGKPKKANPPAKSKGSTKSNASKENKSKGKK